MKTHIGPFPPNDGKEWDYQCARCGSTADFLECEACGGEGVSGHDCGEDCCCCEDPEDNIRCDICNGACGWYVCLSTEEWCEQNPYTDPPRGRGQIEWFCLAEEDSYE